MGDFLDLSKLKKVIDYMEQVVARRKEYIVLDQLKKLL